MVRGKEKKTNIGLGLRSELQCVLHFVDRQRVAICAYVCVRERECVCVCVCVYTCVCCISLIESVSPSVRVCVCVREKECVGMCMCVLHFVDRKRVTICAYVCV